jgi:proline iminopeptidase
MKSLAEFIDGEYLPSNGGTTFVRTLGEGAPLLVVHGGPGLDHTYLVKWLTPLAQYRTLVFYDQSGSGKDRTPLSDVSFQATVTQLENVIESLGLKESLSVLTHSWGANILLALLKGRTTIQPVEVILSNPTGLTLERFNASGERLIGRMPEHVVDLIGRLDSSAEKDAGIQLMKTALPYYVASPEKVPEVEFQSYQSSVYAKV